MASVDNTLIFRNSTTGTEKTTQPTLPPDPKIWATHQEETAAHNPQF